ncbi:hypothetical protein AB7M29_004873 [Pseudomonas sp. F-14 TE3623]
MPKVQQAPAPGIRPPSSSTVTTHRSPQESSTAPPLKIPGKAQLAQLTGIHAEKNGRSRISDEFVWSGHMGALEEASRKGNFAVSFRSAGKATLDALARGAAAKGHDILEKTIKKSSIENAYGAEKAPSVLAAVKSAGIEGYVGHWNSTGLVGIYLSGKNEHDKPIYPIDIKDLESSLASLKSKVNWPTIPFTGDYDMHDLITFRGAGPPRTVLADSKEEKDIIDLMNRQVAEVDPNRPFEVKQRNTIRHGPQVNFFSHMVASESEVVAKSGGVLGLSHGRGSFQWRCSIGGSGRFSKISNSWIHTIQMSGHELRKAGSPEVFDTLRTRRSSTWSGCLIAADDSAGLVTLKSHIL